MSDNTEEKKPLDFIRQIVADDLKTGKHKQSVTRFPPEPNGFLHIGHAKSICLNFGIAEEFGGRCNLRFDDTNPSKEEEEYVDAIKRDVEWLGFKWAGDVHYASDYFHQLYDMALELIKKGKAYVCELDAEKMREYRGTLTTPGKNSPWRDRSVEENLELFARMKEGEFAEGSHVLRAKIDMASPNFNLRDPVIYRILNAVHHRTGSEWHIYPMYDYTHCLSDMLEGITHSLCTLEFQDHRPLYDWVLDTLETPCHPQQIEFARLNLSYFITSKRKLRRLVEEKHVSGWDDPRMLTVSGIRRRGYTPASLRNFCTTIGIGRSDSRIDLSVLEDELRNDLNVNAPRRICVLDPLKLIVDNFPEDKVDMVDGKNHPQNPEMGTRPLPFTKELYIEREDFMEEPPKKYFRLGPGREVRLKYGYLVQYVSHEKDSDGNITAVHCTFDPESRGGFAVDGHKVKGTIHWVSASEGKTVTVNLYERLFSVPDPETDSEVDFIDQLNPYSIKVVTNAVAEPELLNLEPDTTVQFERMGYFCIDLKDSAPGKPVFNRAVTLRDSWKSK
ncbi:glutamine--tRNA ligase/YqeY domain fusion protein [Desulforhopalus vacuolatus]|uniref:glutamine--tRNA ligase/YqeY domain fusion protein n=1 Tax=Desulforhopalus vacuolatus TaxID=40414 RepID=UPI001966C6B8|nr:glutamine--tRNA ligase/YqeY domain fusion protein [Desulforhopalus vacuolatus]MBM9520005.1 glutamine--tRNA ligase/YqeY domain fusion protein [Desulforhopalus vacuolatus]